MPEKMNRPLTIWAHSFCRSTLSLYAEVKRQHKNDVQIIMCGPVDPELRARAGFRSSEFDNLDIQEISPTIERAQQMLGRSADRIHMFCAYHGSSFFERLIEDAIAKKIDFFIGSEAPQNMEGGFGRMLAKEFFIRHVLPRKVQHTVRNGRFILSYSGNDASRLVQIGWPKENIESFGYYPPPLLEARPELKVSPRPSRSDTRPIVFLSSGTHCPHKSPETLVKASAILKEWGLGEQFKCVILGDGVQTPYMLQHAAKLDLPVSFPGFVALEHLIEYYRNADVFVGTGVNEPWGIRVNDALSLGCPSIISTGMGAVALLSEGNFGWSYRSGSAEGLARVMRNLIEAPHEIDIMESNILETDSATPAYQADKFLEIIGRRFANWSLADTPQ